LSPPLKQSGSELKSFQKAQGVDLCLPAPAYGTGFKRGRPGAICHVSYLNFRWIQVNLNNIVRLPRLNQTIRRNRIFDDFPDSPSNLPGLYPSSFCSHR
jgi:hypothetical protein